MKRALFSLCCALVLLVLLTACTLKAPATGAILTVPNSRNVKLLHLFCG
jgi:predicted small lipoprotein YifL